MNKPIEKSSLPPGQYVSGDFPRFGLSPYANRYRKNFGPIRLSVSIVTGQTFSLTGEHLEQLVRTTQASDFHCVTTWTAKNIRWAGFRFIDFFEQLVKPRMTNADSIHWVIFKSLDGYRSRMLLSDLLQTEVLLADELDGKALCSAHGAPLRLIAPSHYGYKNPKHLKAIEFHGRHYQFKPPLLSFMEHPRARVELEERGRFFPGWLLRLLYRPLIRSTVRRFELAMLEKKN
jgi:DMSO/TMAO reductase YedYZ molybdopterin-dependent catalytic subunit